MIRTIVTFLFLLLGAGILPIGCVQQAAPTPTSTPSPTLPVTPGPTPTVRETPAATPSPTETAGLVFFLKVTSPQNEAIIDTATIEVSGQTTPDSAVSVNGQFVEVDASGRFKTRITLAPGVNTIDVVASDFSGRRAAAEVLTVLYVAG
ncbi:MAG: hypothetical protein AAB303_03325 [Chloroflexota bacterium]